MSRENNDPSVRLSTGCGALPTTCPDNLKLTLAGLYEGSRRVRAKLESGYWLLDESEQKLIARFGKKKISERANSVDLAERYSLVVHPEKASSSSAE